MDHVKTVQFYRTGKKFDICIREENGEFGAVWTCLSCSMQGTPLPFCGTPEDALNDAQSDAVRHQCPEES